MHCPWRTGRISVQVKKSGPPVIFAGGPLFQQDSENGSAFPVCKFAAAGFPEYLHMGVPYGQMQHFDEKRADRLCNILAGKKDENRDSWRKLYSISWKIVL